MTGGQKDENLNTRIMQYWAPKPLNYRKEYGMAYDQNRPHVKKYVGYGTQAIKHIASSGRFPPIEHACMHAN